VANVGEASSVPAGTSIWSSKTAPTTTKTGTSSSDGLGRDDFMKLLLAQLQHQDPLKPMDDQAFIAQVAQFNALEQMEAVNKTLSALFDSQQLSEASGLIGKTIEATDKAGDDVTGVVTGVSIESGVAKLHVGNKVVELDKITKVAFDEAALPAGDAVVAKTKPADEAAAVADGEFVDDAVPVEDAGA
jgi:flagellar basal-body rod modification protein FlgD